MVTDPLRVYTVDELGADGYPLEWHRTIKHDVRAEAGHRCVRCGHPYSKGEGEWSECDEECTHIGPLRLWTPDGDLLTGDAPPLDPAPTVPDVREAYPTCRVEARWRILTVHHLTGEKADCRWWNLAALCQRDHLYMQGRVIMDRPFILEHSDWFKPYAAGFYAWKYLGEELSREEVVARQDELLAFEDLGAAGTR